MNDKVIEIFYLIDDFYKKYKITIGKYTLEDNNGKKRRNRASRLNGSEVMTILILFHLSHYRTLKHFYIEHVQKHIPSEFPQTVSHN